MSAAASKRKTAAAAKKHSLVFWAVLVLFLIATLIMLVNGSIFILEAHLGHHDTRWFWASGQLLVHRSNPYDPIAVGRMQADLGILVDTNNVVRNPPPALFLTIPLGFLAGWESVPVWSLFLAVCLGFSVMAIRATLQKPYDRRYLWLAWCFAPAICCIEVGQTGLVLLLGLALFLRFHQSRPMMAGIALSLCAIKPHLFLPFGVVLIGWVILRKKWGIVLGAILALVVESLIAMAFDSHVWAHYLAAIRTQNIEGMFVPTFGVALRFLVDRSALWLEFIPAAMGCAWAVWYFLRNRERWDWQTHGSLLTLVSMTVAPYSWFTDQAIALPAILFALVGAKKLRRGSLTLLLALMTMATVARLLTETLYFPPFLWIGIAWLGWYIYAMSGSALDMTAPARGR
jgi:hypothetical protein